MLQTLKGQAEETALCNGFCAEFEVPAQLTKITILRNWGYMVKLEVITIYRNPERSNRAVYTLIWSNEL